MLARLALLGTMLATAGCMTPADRAGDAAGLDTGAIIASPLRTDQDRANDGERHPAEFLRFTGIEPGQRALDVSAGGGYTSELLALAAGPGGRVYAQAPKPGAALEKRVADHRQPQLVVVAQPFDDPVPAGVGDLDLVTLVQNYHDIAYLPVDRARMNARIFAALRHGGRYVVIDHSAAAGAGTSVTRTLHRIDEAVVLDEVKRAGFVLEAEGDFLRNPADPRDTASTRATIPTDKFALRFVKP